MHMLNKECNFFLKLIKLLQIVPDRKLLFFLPPIAGRQAQIIILEMLNVFLWL